MSVLVLWECFKSVKTGGFTGMTEYEIFPFISLRSNIFPRCFKSFQNWKKWIYEQLQGRKPRRVSMGSPSGKMYLGKGRRAKKKEMQK